MAQTEHAPLGTLCAYVNNFIKGNHYSSNPPHLKDSGTPALLLPGFFATRGVLFTLEEFLKERGIVSLSTHFGRFNTQSILESARHLSLLVPGLLKSYHVDAIDLVGHSMGGLIGLTYIKFFKGHHYVRRLITMGSPVNGTWSAILGTILTGFSSKAAFELLPNSSFLKELHSHPTPSNVAYHAVHGKNDLLCRLSSTLSKEAKNHMINTTHTGLLLHQESLEMVAHLLRSSPV